MGTKIHKKSVKIQAWNSKCPLLCSQVSQNRPKVPKHAKVEPPIMLNDRFAVQECQGPLPTMPRNCNPEAASTDRGPAAEGVAHKYIIFSESKESLNLWIFESLNLWIFESLNLWKFEFAWIIGIYGKPIFWTLGISKNPLTPKIPIPTPASDVQ